MPDELKAFLIIGGIITLMIWLGYTVLKSSRENIQEWAKEKGYEILKLEFRAFRKGPFLWRSTENQTVHYVQIEDNGQVREGFIRQGSFILGVNKKKNFQIRWLQPGTKETVIEDYS